MLKGYRCVIVAAVGWLTLCAQHPNAVADPEQRQSEARVGDALTSIATTYRKQAERAQRAPERQPCGPAEYKSNDDLCAQWKAADAAEKAAWWAAFAGWFGGLSFLGVMGAIGLAFHANWIARDTSKRELRAYIGVAPKGILAQPDGSATVAILVTNHGQTPAYNLSAWAKIAVVEDPSAFRPDDISRDLNEQDGATVVNPGPGFHIYGEVGFINEQNQEAVRDKRMAIVHYGALTYRDCFGVERRTRYCHYHWGEELSDSEAKHSKIGNSAT